MSGQDQVIMESCKADISIEEAKSLIKSNYGFNVTEISELNSWGDRNMFFQVSDTGSNICPTGYVLKILNSEDSKLPSFVEGLHDVMARIADNVIKTPTVVSTTDGCKYFVKQLDVFRGCRKESTTEVEIPKQMDFIVRVFEFVPGKCLRDVPIKIPLIYDLGTLCAKIVRCLADFQRPGIIGNENTWTLSAVSNMRNAMDSLDDHNKALVTQVLDKFENEFLTEKNEITKSIIHNDLNPFNILVTEADNMEYKISGLLDFGDCQYDYNIYELAILIAHVMMVAQLDPIEAGGHCLAGYLAHQKLTKWEFNSLPICVAARFSQCIVLCSDRYKKDPTNEYLLSPIEISMHLLQQMFSVTFDGIRQKWKEILSMDPYGIII